MRAALSIAVSLFLATAIAQTTGGHMALQLTTNAFQHEKDIPAKYTCKGADLSPAFSWSSAPEGTQSFAFIADDPDAPGGTWVHWVAWNIPASVTSLPEGFPKDAELKDGTRQGKNDFGKLGYNGPCPPPGAPHRYFFHLYAVNAKLDLKPGASRQDLDRALAGKVLAQTELMGKFKR
jgi:Raf kinase inhibitor-like YbhB/YbcL family protein